VLQNDSTSAGGGGEVHSDRQRAFEAWMAGASPQEAWGVEQLPPSERAGTGGAQGSLPAARAATEAPLLSLIHRNKAWKAGEGDRDKALGDRVKRYGAAKKTALAIAEFGIQSENAEWISQGLKQQACGWYLLFRQMLTGDRSARLVAAQFCSLPTCPFCSIRRSAKTLGAYLPKIMAVRLQNPSSRLLFVTLTVRDSQDLKEVFGRLEGGLGGLMQRSRDRRRGKGASVMQGVLGGVGQFEVKKGAGKQLWHPHYHGLWLHQGRMDFGRLQEEWGQLAGDAGAWCKVKHLDTERQIVAGARLEDLQEVLAGDVSEVIKYPMKFGDMTPLEVWQAWDILRGKRMLRSFGCLRGVEVPESLLDEPIDWRHLEYVELLYRYQGQGFFKLMGQPDTRLVLEGPSNVA
jgi:hypothetical protein